MLFYKGSEDGLPGWVRQHFPDFSRWVASLTPEEAWCEWDLSPEYVAQILSLNHFWPEAGVIRQRFSASWADQVVNDMFCIYLDFSASNVRESANPSMLSAHDYRYTLASMIAEYCRDDVLATWMYTVNGRGSLDPDTGWSPLEFGGLWLGYWTALETRWMAKQLLPLYEDLEQYRKKGLHRFDAYLEGQIETAKSILYWTLESCKAVTNNQGLIFTCS